MSDYIFIFLKELCPILLNECSHNQRQKIINKINSALEKDLSYGKYRLNYICEPRPQDNSSHIFIGDGRGIYIEIIDTKPNKDWKGWYVRWGEEPVWGHPQDD